MADLLFVALLGAFYIAFGRSGSADRVPLKDLTARQFGVALLHGIATFHRLHERRRDAMSPTGRARQPDRPLLDCGHFLPEQQPIDLVAEPRVLRHDRPCGPWRRPSQRP